MRFRKTIFWLHFAVGIIAGMIILVMAVTGFFLAFERPVTKWAERTEARPGMRHLGPEALLAKATAAQPDIRPVSIAIRSDVTQPVMVGFGQQNLLLLDRYSGNVISGMSGTRRFFHFIEDLHRRLAMGTLGRNITGVTVLAFFFMILSGLFLWIPRSRAHWTRNTLRAFMLPDFKVRGRARDWSLHNAAGFWSAPLLLVTVATGIVMAHPWANDLLYRATGTNPPPRRNGLPAGETAAGAERKKPAPLNMEGLDGFWDRAESAAPGWQSLTLRIPASIKGALNFQVDESDGARPDKRWQASVDVKTGEVSRRERYEDYNMGRRLRSWMQPIHTGNALGNLTRIIAAATSLGAVLLIWTGFRMAWRRFIGICKTRRPLEQAPSATAIPE